MTLLSAAQKLEANCPAASAHSATQTLYFAVTQASVCAERDQRQSSGAQRSLRGAIDRMVVK
jgi:hypothetical protein